MMFADAFAEVAAAVSQAFGGPFHAGKLRWPGEPVMEGGSIVTPGTPEEYDCQVQIDIVTEAMRSEAGYTDKDVRLIVLAPALVRKADTSATVEVLAGQYVPADHVGTWMIASEAQDVAGCAYDGRGRKLAQDAYDAED
jgi:hypothetical protein